MKNKKSRRAFIEITFHLSYQIRATDGGTPSKSNSVRVNVVVLPIPETSEHPPRIKQSNQQVDVTEGDTAGFFVALIPATDEDGDHLWFYLDGEYSLYGILYFTRVCSQTMLTVNFIIRRVQSRYYSKVKTFRKLISDLPIVLTVFPGLLWSN